MRPNPERARLLRDRGYNVAEIVEHMNAEERDVHRAEVVAWLAHAAPPKLYDFEGKRLTLAEIAATANVDRRLLTKRVARGLSVADAITRPISSPRQAARTADSPWRTKASCGGGTR